MVSTLVPNLQGVTAQMENTATRSLLSHLLYFSNETAQSVNL